MAAVLNVKPHQLPNYNFDNGYGQIPVVSLGATVITKDNMEEVLKDSYIDLDAVLAE